MFKVLVRSVIVTLVFAVLLCGVYPAIIYGVGKVLFPAQAKGSIVYAKDGHAVGSKLIGQAFTRPEYFHGRPSAAGTGYDAANSSGSNLGPTNQKFVDGLKANIDAFLKENPGVKKGEIPVDLVTASGSGLDPHISPDGARVQVARIALARGVGEAEITQFVESHVEGPELGLFGEPVLNVLMTNIDLDVRFPKKN